MKQYHVAFTPEATDAIKEAATYIRGQSGPQRARTWLNHMLKAIDGLEKLPTAHAIVTYHDGRAVHSMLVKSHRVYYVVDELSSTVYVLDAVHTARETKLRKYRPK